MIDEHFLLTEDIDEGFLGFIEWGARWRGGGDFQIWPEWEAGKIFQNVIGTGDEGGSVTDELVAS